MRRLNWFSVVILLSIAIRLYLAILTEGTYDVEIWQNHASNIGAIGLTWYYKLTLGTARTFNHPPVAGELVAGLLSISKYINLPFRIVFRLFICTFDYAIAYSIWKILKPDYRRIGVAFYLLNPLTLIFSAYHGNTDTMLGLFILLSIYALARQRPVAAGVALGSGVWIKWIILLALPAIVFAISGIGKKCKYGVAVTITALLGYSWYIVKDPAVVWNSVFGYTGQLIQTTGGIPIWGNRIVLGWILSWVNYGDPGAILGAVLRYNNICIIALVIGYSWLRRRRQEAEGIARTVGEVFVVFYALSNYWAFQYLAWSAPFLVFLDLPAALLVSTFCGGYIYALYAVVCDSWLLRGSWDFIGHPELSGTVLFFRDAAIVLLLTLTILLFYCAARGRDSCWEGGDWVRRYWIR